MATFRGLFVRKDATAGTSPADARKALAGLIHRLSTGAPRQGLLSPVQVVGTSGWAYSVPAAWWATSRGLTDGVVLAGSDGAVSAATDPAPATGARIDIVYVLHRDVDQADPDSASVVGVAKGLASGSPVAPTIPAGAMEIARATVAAGQANTLAATISQTATYTGLAGADIVIPGSAGPSPYTALSTLVPSAPAGARVFSIADNALYVRASGAWQVLWRQGMSPQIQQGSVTVDVSSIASQANSAGAATTFALVFPGAPRVTLTLRDSNRPLTFFTTAVSATGFTVVAKNVGSAALPAATTITADWIAVYG